MPQIIRWPAGNVDINGDGEMKAPPDITSHKSLDSDKSKSSDAENEKQVYKTLKVIRVLPKASETYELETFQKNALLIFNTMHIKNYSPRYGSEKDVEQLILTFSKLNFEVTVYNDLKVAEVMRSSREFSERDFTDYGCIAVAILSHGSDVGLLATDGIYKENDIIHCFTADKPTLITKPKIFIIQACRGINDPTGVDVRHPRGTTVIPEEHDEDEPYTIPLESDMLILHSSYIGKPSFRSAQHGSWFIQSLCNKINQLAETRDLESILTEVKREVAIEHTHQEFNRGSLDNHFLKQMPVVTSTLIRKLYLRKREEHKLKSVFIEDSKPVFQGGSETIVVKSKVSSELESSDCDCYLEHFEYMRNCLRFYLDEYPDDTLAKSFYRMAKAFRGPAFNESKKRMQNVIVHHLREKNFEYFKYIHIYDHKLCESRQQQKKTDEQKTHINCAKI